MIVPALSETGVEPSGIAQRPSVECGAEFVGDVGFVERRFGRLRLGDHMVERSRVAALERGAGELGRAVAGEALDQRGGTLAGRSEFEAPADSAGESRPPDRKPLGVQDFRSASRSLGRA